MAARTHLIVTLLSYCLPCITLCSLRGTSSNYTVALILVPKLSPAISREIFGGESGARSDFSPSSQAVICQYHSTVAAEFSCCQQDRWARPGKLLMAMVFRNWGSSQGALHRKGLLRTSVLVVMKPGTLLAVPSPFSLSGWT
jgi:hypothetical protein